jgi:hypothetical protein
MFWGKGFYGQIKRVHETPGHHAVVTMVITSTLIEAGKSLRGGWNGKQLQLLGVSWPPSPGWQDKVEGKPIHPEIAEQFINLSGQTVRTARQKKLKKPLKSELPFPASINPDKALPLQSVWVWLEKQSPEDRVMLQEVLLYMTRKNDQAIKVNQSKQP